MISNSHQGPRGHENDIEQPSRASPCTNMDEPKEGRHLCILIAYGSCNMVGLWARAFALTMAELMGCRRIALFGVHQFRSSSYWGQGNWGGGVRGVKLDPHTCCSEPPHPLANQLVDPGTHPPSQPRPPRGPCSGEKSIWLQNPRLLEAPIVERNQYGCIISQGWPLKRCTKQPLEGLPLTKKALHTHGIPPWGSGQFSRIHPPIQKPNPPPTHPIRWGICSAKKKP